MSCEDCKKKQDEPGIAYYRWKIANVAMKGCDKHLREIFDVLNKHQQDIEMGIELNILTKADIGKWVEYASHNATEKGRIKSFNDKWIFVVFHCDDKWDNFKNYTAAACPPESITIIEPPDKDNKET